LLIGEQSGNALANVLFGKVNPSGKLSVSFPSYVGSLPSYYNYNKGGRTTDPGHIYAVSEKRKTYTGIDVCLYTLF
jgi:hypothetical protein